jgi:hypothetical protein
LKFKLYELAFKAQLLTTIYLVSPRAGGHPATQRNFKTSVFQACSLQDVDEVAQK